jgi:hypothetical protein
MRWRLDFRLFLFSFSFSQEAQIAPRTMRAAISDWEQFAYCYGESAAEEFSLSRLNPGDVLRVVTEHTNYLFTVINDHEARLKCSRSDRPSGSVRISGCGFGFSHAFKPGHLFCGGRMEFTFVENDKLTRYRTTSIRAIVHRQQSI